MSNNQRFRSGPEQVVSGRIQAGVKAEIGDMVALVSDYVVPANTFDSSLGVPAALAAFKAAFLGVLIEGATSGGETTDTACLVATDGDFEYPVDPATVTADMPPGTYLTVGNDPTPDLLINQELQVVADATNAVCQASRQLPEASNIVTVRIFSSIMGNPLA